MFSTFPSSFQLFFIAFFLLYLETLTLKSCIHPIWGIFNNMIRREKGMCAYERIENPSMLTDWWLACKFTANYWGKPTSFSDITLDLPLKTKKYIFCFDKSLIFWLGNCKPIMTFTKCFLTSLMSVFVYFTVVCWQVLGDL